MSLFRISINYREKLKRPLMQESHLQSKFLTFIFGNVWQKNIRNINKKIYNENGKNKKN